MDDEKVPFVTRKNLSFEKGAKIALRVIWTSSAIGYINVVGTTKDSTFTYRVGINGPGDDNPHILGLTDIPLWLSVTDPLGIFFSGEVHVKIFLEINGDVVQMLAAGFVSFGQAIAFPNGTLIDAGITKGNLTRYSVTNPGAGNEIGANLQSASDSNLLSMVFTFTTSATVANRRIVIKILGQNGEMYRIISPMAQGASVAMEYRLQRYNPAAPLFDGNVVIIPLPENILMIDTPQIQTITTNLQIGDAFTNAKIYVEEFINYNV